MKLWKTIICAIGLIVPILSHADPTYTASDNFHVRNVRVDQEYTDPNGNKFIYPDAVKLFNDDSSTPMTLSNEAVAIGGLANPNGPVAHKTLSVVGLPYGPYGLGCVECIFSTKDSYDGSGAQAALSGINYWYGSKAINYGDMATAMTYRGFTNEHVRFTERVSYFDQDEIYLVTPMTTAQMAQLHEGMYITSNSLDPTCTPALDSTGVYNDCRLKAIIRSWTPTSIQIFGWGRVGGGDSVGSPMPHPTKAEMTANTDITNYLDSVYETQKIPLVYIGAGGKDFAGNDYLIIDANNAYSTQSTPTTTADSPAGSTVIPVSSTTGILQNAYFISPYVPYGTTVTFVDAHNNKITLSSPITSDIPSGSTLTFNTAVENGSNLYELMERDTRIWHATAAHPISFHGTTESFECDDCEAGGINNDAYAYLVNGPGLPRAFVAQVSSDSLEYSGYNTYLPSNGAPSTTGDNRVAFAFRKQLPTNNTYALVARTVKDLDGSGFWSSWDMRLGLIIDPKLSGATVSGGASVGDIAWNPNGMSGHICFMANDLVTLCSSNDVVDTYIPAEFHTDITVDGELHANTLTLSSATFQADSAGSTTSSDSTVGGQGTIVTWNNIIGGGADTEFVNVNPSGAFAGGFAFFVGDNGNTLSSLLKVLQLNEWDIDAYRPIVVHGYGITSDYIRTSTSSKTISTIQSESHSEGDKEWCHDCRSPGQAAGAGTGRWIVLDSASTWRTEDGIVAAN